MDFKENLLYEIYLTDNASIDEFDVGYFIAKDDEYAVFQCVASDGLVGALVLLKMEDIWNLRSNTLYCQALQKLIKYHETVFEKVLFKTKNLKKELLELAQKTRAIVGIELRNSNCVDLFGFIESISGNSVCTLEISDEGYNEGTGHCRFDDITKVHMNANRHRKYKILFDINYKS